MKIALLGYGKMGKAIEQIALSRGHQIVLKLDNMSKKIDFKKADIAIDFSVPEAAFHNIHQALSQNIPIVSGTTGWINRIEEVIQLCNIKNGSFIYSSNFSLGVNLFFSLNTKLAKLMQNFDYEPSIIETHHTHKIDCPSGTAITLANMLIPYSIKNGWTQNENQPNKLQIKSIREDEVPGTHVVIYKSEIDEIEIKHTAHNRTGFAQGAILAAEYIVNKKGVFSMKDVLGLK